MQEQQPITQRQFERSVLALIIIVAVLAGAVYFVVHTVNTTNSNDRKADTTLQHSP